MKQRQISTNYKTNQRMRIGATAKVMLVVIVTAGFAVCQTLTGMATNRDQNEPLDKQPANAEQNLSIASQKQEVNGAGKPKSQNGTLIKTLGGGNSVFDSVLAVSFSPDGQTIASGGGYLDNTIKLWQPDGTLIKTLRGHNSYVYGVSFSPDGQTIASSSYDKTIKLWQRDGTLITTLRGHTDVVWCVHFSPDGQTIASGSADGSIKLWNLNQVASQKQQARGLKLL